MIQLIEQTGGLPPQNCVRLHVPIWAKAFEVSPAAGAYSLKACEGWQSVANGGRVVELPPPEQRSDLGGRFVFIQNNVPDSVVFLNVLPASAGIGAPVAVSSLPQVQFNGAQPVYQQGRSWELLYEGELTYDGTYTSSIFNTTGYSRLAMHGSNLSTAARALQLRRYKGNKQTEFGYPVPLSIAASQMWTWMSVPADCSAGLSGAASASSFWCGPAFSFKVLAGTAPGNLYLALYGLRLSP